MDPVDFWIVVVPCADGFKRPLREIFDSEEQASVARDAAPEGSTLVSLHRKVLMELAASGT